MMSRIKEILGREIIDSRGIPTVEVEITLENEIKSHFTASIDIQNLIGESNDDQEKIKEKIYSIINENSKRRVNNIPPDAINSLEKMVLLKILV